MFLNFQEKITKEEPEEEEVTDDFSANRKRRITRVKVRKKDKGESKQAEDPKRQKVELKGPRVKHVCRSASIVLGQPIATFPTQEEKESKDKVANVEDEIIPTVEKNKAIMQIPSYESETEPENKAPLLDLQVMAEPPVTKDSEIDVQVEPKKRKIETALAVKAQPKAESSEDETVMDLVPRKMTLKPLSNITNVRKLLSSNYDEMS